jgi:protein-S-isoprenylcysteine O-methyltransferase Ste14
MLILFQGAVLSLSAGTFAWWPGWAYLGLYLFLIVANAILILPNEQGLIEERSQAKGGMRPWDRMFARVTALLGPAILLIGGLDARFGWPPVLPFWLQVAAGGVIGVSYLLFAWAMASNRFFSAIVRVQLDRGHTVVSTGPYRFVRHPAYAGMLVFGLATPLLLGSAWALIPAVLLDTAVIARTALEDATLQRELEGYAEYSLRVRFRLVPGVW